MKKYYSIRLFLLFLLLVLLFSFAYPYLVLRKTRIAHEDITIDALYKMSNILLQELSPILASNNNEQIKFFIRNTSYNSHIALLDKNCNIIADNLKENRIINLSNYKNEINEALSGKKSAIMYYDTINKQEAIGIFVPVTRENEIIGVFYISSLMVELDRLKTHIIRNTLYISIISIILSFIMSCLAGDYFLKPINIISNAAKAVIKGDYSTRVFFRYGDEISILALNFNEMVAHIEEKISIFSEQNEELNTILSSLQEGLLLIDKNVRIKYANRRISEILGHEVSTGKFLWETVKDPDINIYINRLLKSKDGGIDELRTGGGIFLVSFAFLEKTEDIIILLYDITDRKRFDILRKDFVDNVSHELRTPLTAIKGYVETIETTENEENKHYLEIIRKHTDRLINIVNDLLLLSSLQKEGQVVEEEVNLKELMEYMISSYEKKISDAGLKIEFECFTENHVIKSDAFKVEQVFINLIDNAIKYTEKGYIRITIHEDDENISVSIKDTGIGISPENQKRIFERFFVADKSRSREKGGTGLGLSIVKHIIHSFNGNIDVSSSPNNGSIFTVVLPKKQIKS
ncbi:MAG: GHKL domain-containing protein [Candidatus Coatesbacteria bacterium]|nr:GHKL domain-containing protein [Candidatus Coatesbacteria bacterium]